MTRTVILLIFLTGCKLLNYTGFEGDINTVLSSAFLTDEVNGKSLDYTYSLGNSVTSLIQYHQLRMFQVFSGGSNKPYSDDGKFSVRVVVDGNIVREVDNIGWNFGLANKVQEAFSWFKTWSNQNIPILDQTQLNSIPVGKTYDILIMFTYQKREVKLVIPMQRVAS